MVLIVLPNGKTFALDVNPNATTLHHLKVAIEQHHGTPVSNQCLFLSQSLGQNDSDLISNLGIGPSSTLTLHVPFYGGTTTPPATPSDIRSADTISEAVKEGGKGVEEAEVKDKGKGVERMKKKTMFEELEEKEEARKKARLAEKIRDSLVLLQHCTKETIEKRRAHDFALYVKKTEKERSERMSQLVRELKEEYKNKLELEKKNE